MGKLRSFRDLQVYQKLKALHHLDVAKDKAYLTADRFHDLDNRYDECGRMLECLHQALSEWRGATRTGNVVREECAVYGSASAEPSWTEAVSTTERIEEDFPRQVSDTRAYGRFFHGMLDRGFYLPPAQFELSFVSAAHTDADIDGYLAAATQTLDEMRTKGAR
jgi:glutamate-1-semialdehyde aminotransferase